MSMDGISRSGVCSVAFSHCSEGAASFFCKGHMTEFRDGRMRVLFAAAVDVCLNKLVSCFRLFFLAKVRE